MRNSCRVLFFVGVLALTASCRNEPASSAPAAGQRALPSQGMSVSSPVVVAGGRLPSEYTCDGKGVSPPLTIQGVPSRAKALALVVTDPDAPGGTFTHWSVWNINPSTTTIAEGSKPRGATEDENGFGKVGWGSPCPPSGIHHYVFTVYALEDPMTSNEEIAAHAFARAQLVTTYGR
jgi:hypothetical protein